MTDTFFPDVNQFVSDVSITAAAAVIARATVGVQITDTSFAGYKKAAGTKLFMPYHVVDSRYTAAEQAQHCLVVAGKARLMIDVEPISADPGPDAHVLGASAAAGITGVYVSSPTVADAAAFADAYKKLGGLVVAAYFPRWYWQAIGSPSFEPLISRGMVLVSSDYTTYSDSGPGWQPYGGLTPDIWQYTDAEKFGGGTCDFNAYRGTVAGLSILFNGPPPPPPPSRFPEEQMSPVIPPGANADDIGVPLAPGQYKTVTFIADPGRRGAPKIEVRCAFHLSGSTWHMEYVTLTPAAPHATVAVPANADGVSFLRLDDVAESLYPAFA